MDGFDGSFMNSALKCRFGFVIFIYLMLNHGFTLAANDVRPHYFMFVEPTATFLLQQHGTERGVDGRGAGRRREGTQSAGVGLPYTDGCSH